MKTESNRTNILRPQGVSRREFLKIAAAAGLLAGCGRAGTPPPTPTPSPTLKPTARPIPPRPEIIRFYPDVPSRVIRARHPGVWNGAELAPEALGQMLDASITKLTGLNDAREAWAALFRPQERIAIKVNSIDNGFVHAPLVEAVVGRLQAAGIPAEQIVIWDRFTFELGDAGFPVNKDGPGVRCYGTDGNTSAGWTVQDLEIRLSNILLDCDALINMPVLKKMTGGTGSIGISFAMKNHFGTFPEPVRFHGDRFPQGVAEINALSPIKDRTRLIIGDVLAVNEFQVVAAGNTIVTSFDPVAHDTIGLQILKEKMAADGQAPEVVAAPAPPWLANGAELGLGTNIPENMEIVEVDLG